MDWICLISGVLAVAVFTSPAEAATISNCPAPPGAVRITLPSGLPPPLRKALPDDIALPGEPFDSTDVYVKGHKHRRYMFVWTFPESVCAAATELVEKRNQIGIKK